MHLPPSPSLPIAPVVLRPPIPLDGMALWDLAGRCGLDLNSPYAYVMWARYHASSSVVAVGDEGQPVGFLTGFAIPEAPSGVFVWQIGVDPQRRGERIGAQLLDRVVEQTGATTVEATVTPDNAASTALFEAFAERHGSEVLRMPCFDEDLLPPGHEPELLFRIPLSRSTRPHQPESEA